MKQKVLIADNGRKFFVADPSKDYHTQFGFISAKDMKKKDGAIIKTNKDKEFVVFSAQFIDLYERIKREAQIITLKDIGAIIAYTGVGKKSSVLDSGSGSGALACFMAGYVKEVISYDNNEKHLKTAQKNKETLGLKNVTFKPGDIYQGIKEKGFDLFTLDVPEPWQAIETAYAALKPGAFLVAYSPNVTQTLNFVNDAYKKFRIIKVIELIEREWEVGGRKARPFFTIQGHTGFLCFARKI